MTAGESILVLPAGVPGAISGDLYSIVRKAVFGYFALHFGSEEAQDLSHDTFILVFQALAKNQIRDLGSLSSFARTVAVRQRGRAIGERMQDGAALRDYPVEGNRAHESHRPDHRLLADERRAAASKLFLGLAERQREVLRRFYLLEQTKEEICASLGLTPTQFRLIKSRAKQRLAGQVHSALHPA